MVGKHTPLVSVIIPTYNRGYSVAKAIKSALNQTYKNIEIIVTDDCSTDGSKESLSEWEGEIIKIVRTPRRLGAAGARNYGIIASQGKYLAFLDSDDTWVPTKLEKHIALYTDESKHCLISVSATKQYRRGTKVFNIKIPAKRLNWKTSIISGEWLSIGSSLVCDRDLFFKVGMFKENLARFEDLDWLIRYFSIRDDLMLVAEPLVEVYASPWPQAKSVATSGKDILESTARLLTKQERKNLESSLHFENAVALYFERKHLQACLELLKALIRYPKKIPYYLCRLIKKIFMPALRRKNLSYKL